MGFLDFNYFVVRLGMGIGEIKKVVEERGFFFVMWVVLNLGCFIREERVSVGRYFGVYVWGIMNKELIIIV